MVIGDRLRQLRDKRPACIASHKPHNHTQTGLQTTRRTSAHRISVLNIPKPCAEMYFAGFYRQLGAIGDFTGLVDYYDIVVVVNG